MDDKFKITAQDVAAQKQAMKKAGTEPVTKAPVSSAVVEKKKPGRKPGYRATPAVAPIATASASPLDLIDKTFALAQECGGIEQLKRLIDRLAQR